MNAQILDGKLVAASIKDKLSQHIIENSLTPTLAVCLVGDDPASQVYIANKRRSCEAIGIRSILQPFPSHTPQNQIIDWIDWCNTKDDVDGILVQLPLPNHFDKNFILRHINPLKDVDCFHPENQGLLMSGHPRFLPCTPAGIMELFKYYGIRPEGKRIAIINNTIVVGQPLMSLLTQDSEWGNATVTVCHLYTKDMRDICLYSDIIVTAVGKPGFQLTASMVRSNQVVIDVGINRIKTAEGKTKVVGDVDFASVSQVVSAITPVPGGIGPLTVAMLLNNTVLACEKSFS